MKSSLCAVLLLPCAILNAQIERYPYAEDFDTVSVPQLPRGWLSSSNRLNGGDFATTASTPHSGPAAVISTNAAIEQELITPLIDLTAAAPESLIFYERRSASHNSDLVIEASTDGGSSFGIPVGDILKNPGTTAYVRRAVYIPGELFLQKSVRLRWRVAGNGTGTTGTLRFDDISITARPMSDLAIGSLSCSPVRPQAGDNVTIRAVVRNAGLQPISHFTTNFYLDTNKNGWAEPGELFYGYEYPQPLNADDSAEILAPLQSVTAGLADILVVINSAADNDQTDDTSGVTIAVGYMAHSVVINEIMYEPAAGSSEYVELYNTSPYPVDFQDWKLTDKPEAGNGTLAHVISPVPVIIGASQYLVIASDSSIYDKFPYLRGEDMRVIVRQSGMSLNNSGDQVILYDFAEHTIDSVQYSPGWHNPAVDVVRGRSLERINPFLSSVSRQNWTTSAAAGGGTPCTTNSVYTKLVPSSAIISAAPNPFSPDGDGFEDMTIISYHLPLKSGIIRVRIYDSQGRLVRVLADGAPAGSGGTLVWNGLSDRRERVKIGIYLIFLEAYDSTKAEVVSAKGVVVVATKL